MVRIKHSPFRFKQFEVHQEECAMKVSTEGCVFGAVSGNEKDVRKILDIGAGTGLLSLMMAQLYPEAEIFAVEINQRAFKQANDNFRQSKWNDRLKLIHIPVQELQIDRQFDLIISNPPFYSSSLKSGDPGKDAARHNDSLTPRELGESIHRLLSNDGKAMILYPEKEAWEFLKSSFKHGIFLNAEIRIRNFPDGPLLRKILKVSRTPSELLTDDLVIRTQPGVYSEQYTKLLEPFYL